MPHYNCQSSSTSAQLSSSWRVPLYQQPSSSSSASSPSSINSSTPAFSSPSWCPSSSSSSCCSPSSSPSWRSSSSPPSCSGVPPASSCTSSSPSAPRQGKGSSGGVQSIRAGTIAYLKSKKDIPADCGIHLQLADDQGAYDHPCIVASQTGATSTIYLVTSRGNRPMTDIVLDYRNRYRLIEHPGASTHDGHPTLRLKRGKMVKKPYVNISNRFTIPTQHLGSYNINNKGALELDRTSVGILNKEAETYEAARTAPKPVLCPSRVSSTKFINTIPTTSACSHSAKNSIASVSSSHLGYGNGQQNKENVDPHPDYLQTPALTRPNSKATARYPLSVSGQSRQILAT